jgi:hypothetical protein
MKNVEAFVEKSGELRSETKSLIRDLSDDQTSNDQRAKRQL